MEGQVDTHTDDHTTHETTERQTTDTHSEQHKNTDDVQAQEEHVGENTDHQAEPS